MTVVCGWACGYEHEVKGYLPTACPRCKRESRWETVPNEQGYTATDLRFLKSMRIGAEV